MIYRSFLCIFAAIFIQGCAETGLNNTLGASLAGGAIGAGLGAIVGSQSNHAGPGIAIGAAAGALSGALLGNALDAQQNEIAAQQRELERQRQLLEENRRLIDALKMRGADVRETERGVVINLPDILFDFNRADLNYDAEESVAEIADVLRTVPSRHISIEGHTDSIGSIQYNKELSKRRAKTVASSLAREGVIRESISISGFGKEQPIASNNTPEGRARNRRVEIIVEN